MSLKSVMQRLKSGVSRGGSETGGFITAPEGKLFPKTDPLIDGEDCLHDCATCTTHYPAKFSIDEDDKLYGHVKGFSTHLVVATGKTDWVRDVSDEEGSIMEAVGKGKIQPSNGKLMLSASNMPLPHHSSNDHVSGSTVLLLPAFKFIDGVTPATVPDLIENHINVAPTNTTPLEPNPSALPTLSSFPPRPSGDSKLISRPCPHRYVILVCSQKTRDARCGQSAPLLRREFERHLRPLGLYRDLTDERPGGCGIYFISHVGGHKYSANVMIYRKAESAGNVNAGSEAAQGSNGQDEGGSGASQLIWLARVKPEDCENIVRYTLLQGKVVDPARQLRGGFDRGRGLVSW